MQSPALLSVKQASEELGVSRPRVQQFIMAGDLRATKVGNYWAIKRRDLEAFQKVPRKAGPKAKPEPSQRRKRTTPPVAEPGEGEAHTGMTESGSAP